jgi:TetR/AcrR family transcriptional regulator of autoinduction and epiphytic fitness
MHQQECAPLRSGRLPECERRSRLLDAAEAILLGKGYHAASMDEIAQQAGMSKKTVYQLYPAKASLFEALLRDRFPVFPVVIEAGERSPREVLTDTLHQAVAHALSDRQLALFRMMVAETPRGGPSGLKELRATARSGGALERWLAAKAKDGTLRIDDPKAAADWLLWGTAGGFVFHTLLRKEPAPNAAAIGSQVRLMVSAFLDSVQP